MVFFCVGSEESVYPFAKTPFLSIRRDSSDLGCRTDWVWLRRRSFSGFGCRQHTARGHKMTALGSFRK